MPRHPGRRCIGACLAVALLLLLRCLAVAGCVEGSPLSDKLALLRLRSSFRDPFGILFSWNPSDSDPCSWFGVSCDACRCVVAVNIAGETCGQPSSFGSVSRGRCPKLAGVLSASIGNLTELRVLSLAFNEISGLIPPEICRLRRLEVLDLRYNRFLGPIPSGISGCRDLRYLNLGGNRLGGTIPASLGYLPRLQQLSLEFNSLSGSIPAKLCQNSRYLEQLQLAGNKLSGVIPAVLGNCRNLRSLFLFSNSFKGSIPPELAGLSDLEILDVSRNSLSGPIPPEFGSLKNLQLFSMADNNITGEIPANLALLPSVKVLSLSKNALSGEIRSKLRGLTVPLLDENNLSGRIRSGSAKPRTLLQDTSPKWYASAPPPPSTSPQVNNGFTSIEIAAITSASAIVSVLIALLLLLLYTRRSVGRSAVAQGPPIKAEVVTFCNIGVKITFGDVARGTGGFNPSNCIGHGGFGATYKAEISPGLLVAIKRLSVGRFQQGARQFEAEIRTLEKIRHPNLVTLIGFHSSETEMFLIYNYLPGGNLEKFIQERSKRPADWRMLHKIALDVAGALAYLHYVCVPRVLHRDIKPSNILLDNNFTAYLSDFGLARLLGASETHATTEVAGTFGYVAPEYAMTSRVSDKADVYSYGVVLLELMSDKKALDPSFSSYGNGFNIVGWAAMLLGQGRACEFFAAGLWEAAPHRDLVETLHLAVRCTDDSLTIRPTMKRVVQRLKELQPSPC